MSSHLDENKKLLEKLQNRMKIVEKEFNSPTMCLAKWLQSTVYLMNGYTHSCHHPVSHKIPLNELENNPGALHNTKYKMQKRQEMLDGKRPEECQYCWNVEDLPGNHLSDRTYKSGNHGWGFSFLNKVKQSGLGENVFPSYLEVAFENTCNFKCMYCSPTVSSKWTEEVKEFGPYNTSWKHGDLEFDKQMGKTPIPNREHNPYIEAFWKWWPELYQNLHTFRITGGEPLLSKNTWKVLESISENPRKNFNFAINSNMGVPGQFIDKLIDYTNKISPHIGNFEIYTSCEAHYKQAEFIRFGLDYNDYIENMMKVLQNTPSKVKMAQMVTFNALSITSFEKYLDDILELRSKFNIGAEENRLPLSISYLRYPQFQDVRILPQKLKDEFEKKILSYVETNKVNQNTKDYRYLYLEEVDQLDRLCKYMNKPLEDFELYNRRKDFGIFYKEYCIRKGLNFEETFPELADFYHECLKIT